MKDLNSLLVVDLDVAQKGYVQLQEQMAEIQNSLATAVQDKETAQRVTAKLVCIKYLKLEKLK